MARRFSDADLEKMIQAFSSSADAAKAVQTAVDSDPLTGRRYGAMLTLIDRYKITGEVTDDLWAKVMQDDAFTPLLSLRSARAMVGRLARLYHAAGPDEDSRGTNGEQAQAKSDPESSTAGGASVPSPHVTAVLRARDEVVALLRVTPHPDTVLEEFQERENRMTWIDPRSSVWPGVLAPTSLAMLFAHTRDDPRWGAFGLADRTAAQPAAPAGLSWLAAYDQAYMGPLLRLVGMLHWVYQEQVVAACKALGNSGPLLPFPAFVLRPIRDVVRMLTGLGPMPGPGYELRYLNPAPTRRPYTLHHGGELIATGVDTRSGALDNGVVDAVMRVHRTMAQRVLEAPDLRVIVRNWERLKEQAEELAAWLEGITPADIERGTCLLCREPEAGKPLGPELAEGIRRFFASEPPAATAPDANAGDALEMHKIVIRGTVDIPAGDTVKVATVRVDGSVEYGPTFRSGSASGTGAPAQPTSPPE